jgi:hypothetical protein
MVEATEIEKKSLEAAYILLLSRINYKNKKCSKYT